MFPRALTPKPWRIGLPSPPGDFPRPADVERRFAEWRETYEADTRNHHTCRFVETLGSGRVLPELEPLVRRHDERTGIERNGTLA